MNHLFFFLFVFWTAFAFAKIEIEAEGATGGWAVNFPTWKKDPSHFISKIFFGGRPATGYHVWINVFVFSLAHIVFIFQNWSLSLQLDLIAFILMFWVFEDFLWFVFNPAFGLKNFKKDKIWWHEKRWYYFAPIEYFIFFPLGLFLYFM